MIFQWVINFMSFFNQGQTIAIGRVFWFTGKVGAVITTFSGIMSSWWWW
jgi:hypothetical protein